MSALAGAGAAVLRGGAPLAGGGKGGGKGDGEGGEEAVPISFICPITQVS